MEGRCCQILKFGHQIVDFSILSRRKLLFFKFFARSYINIHNMRRAPDIVEIREGGPAAWPSTIPSNCIPQTPALPPQHHHQSAASSSGSRMPPPAPGRRTTRMSYQDRNPGRSPPAPIVLRSIDGMPTMRTASPDYCQTPSISISQYHDHSSSRLPAAPSRQVRSSLNSKMRPPPPPLPHQLTVPSQNQGQQAAWPATPQGRGMLTTPCQKGPPPRYHDEGESRHQGESRTMRGANDGNSHGASTQNQLNLNHNYGYQMQNTNTNIIKVDDIRASGAFANGFGNDRHSSSHEHTTTTRS